MFVLFDIKQSVARLQTKVYWFKADSLPYVPIVLAVVPYLYIHSKGVQNLCPINLQVYNISQACTVAVDMLRCQYYRTEYDIVLLEFVGHTIWWDSTILFYRFHSFTME